jgi:hypothetical protein
MIRRGAYENYLVIPSPEIRWPGGSKKGLSSAPIEFRSIRRQILTVWMMKSVAPQKAQGSWKAEPSHKYYLWFLCSSLRFLWFFSARSILAPNTSD